MDILINAYRLNFNIRKLKELSNIKVMTGY